MDATSIRMEVVAGKAAGTSIVVEDELLIGRHADGVGRLADDEEISRAHARVSVDNGGFCAIEDLGSTNGTFVNGMRISSPQTLSIGDTLEIGANTLVVREIPSPSEPEGPPPTEPFEQHNVVPGVTPASPAPEAVVVPDAEPPAAEAPLATPFAAPEPIAAPEPFAAPDPPAPEPVVPDPSVEPEVPVLSLRLEVDFAGSEARVFLSEGTEPACFSFEDGAWRSRPAGPAE